MRDEKVEVRRASMRWSLLLLLPAVVVLAVEVDEDVDLESEVEVDTRERAERADLPSPSRPLRRPGSGSGFSSFLSGEYLSRPPQVAFLTKVTKFSHSIGIRVKWQWENGTKLV